MYRINGCIDLEKVEKVLYKIQNRTNLLSLDSRNLKIIHEVANLIKVNNLKIKYFISNRDENLYKIFKHHLYKVVNLCILRLKNNPAFYRAECFFIFTYITRNFSCFITGSNKNEINNFKVKSSLCGDIYPNNRKLKKLVFQKKYIANLNAFLFILTVSQPF